MMMKNMLVTGGAGFIGANFVRYVLDNTTDVKIYNLDALTYAGSLENLRDLADPQRHTFVQGNICDQELAARLMREHDIDTVVHFAAETHVDRSILGPSVFVETNINGTFNLLEAARQYWLGEKKAGAGEVRFHHVSTDEVYGSLAPGDPAWTEDTPYAPNSPYSASKAASDHLVRAYGHTYGLPVTISNCTNNYGPYQFPEKLIPLMIANALEDKPLPVYGDGLQVRDWLYVEDHCRGVRAVLEKGREGEIYNIGGNRSLPNLEVIRMILAATGKPESLIRSVTDRPGHDRRYALSSAKLMRETGWVPEVTFEQGLPRTIEWYRGNPGWVARVRSGEYQAYYERNYGSRKAVPNPF